MDPAEVNPQLKPHTRDIARWAVRGGRRAIFAAFGLHKTAAQLEIMRLIGQRRPQMLRLIVLPLGVRHEFKRDAEKLFQGEYAIKVKFIRYAYQIEDPDTIYLTNYESVREGILDVSRFGAVSLDEAAVLADRGSKTFGEFVFSLFQDAEFKFVATATPSPNEFQELLSYAAFLGVSDISQARTRFFKRNSEHADQLTLHPHHEAAFWMWLSTWAVFLQKPSDLGYSDEGYELPPLDIRWHELPTSHINAGQERSGQQKLIKNTAAGVTDAAREKRESLKERIAKMAELVDGSTDHFVIWHDLEAERKAIEKAWPSATTVYGAQKLEDRELAIIAFAEGRIGYLATKPVIAGSGCNLQRHCHRAVFLGIGFKFRDFIQAVHRLHRFQQTKRVRIDLIYTEAERQVRQTLERKWEDYKTLTSRMSEIIRKYGLATTVQLEAGRYMFTPAERAEVRGENFLIANNDSVYEARAMAADSLHLVLTSIPFSTQYEYTHAFNDLGHTDDNEHFFAQMDYLTPELYRVLKPGRVAAIHVKDRIVDGGMSRLGFQTVYPFHADVIRHFQKHSFAFLGMKTIVTDVVRENNQTYRLGYTEQCKDGSRMGFGLSEYFLVFRKPPSDRSNGYADEPPVKSKADYSRARWQIDAHGFSRSNGNRLIPATEMLSLKWGVIYRMFRAHSLTNVYDYEEHVTAGEVLDAGGRLPVDFMLLPPQSWHPEVWTDITRMRTLNGAQAAAGRVLHIAPLQFDIVDRAIRQYTEPGETVFDPFNGIGTVSSRAVRMGRKAIGCELNPDYHRDAVYYTRQAECEATTPTLFDLVIAEEEFENLTTDDTDSTDRIREQAEAR